MATNPALLERTTLVAEEPWKAVLRRTLLAVAGALDRLLPPHRTRSIGRSNSPPSGSNILQSERPRVPWHLWPTDDGVAADGEADACTAPSWTGLSHSAEPTGRLPMCWQSTVGWQR